MFPLTTLPACLSTQLSFHLSISRPLAAPDNLWGATLLLAVGGNTIRMSGLQFGNLFPEHRNTAMAIISGIFTPSAGIMVLLQVCWGGGGRGGKGGEGGGRTERRVFVWM